VRHVQVVPGIAVNAVGVEMAHVLRGRIVLIAHRIVEYVHPVVMVIVRVVRHVQPVLRTVAPVMQLLRLLSGGRY